MVVIYKLTTPSGKIYIGQTKDIKHRFYAYKRGACIKQPKLYYSIQKYGWDNMKKELLEYANEEIADTSEQSWIKYFDSVNKGLNCQLGGIGVKTKGYSIKPHNKKHRKNLSISHTGKKHSIETKQKMSNSGKKKVFSEEHKKRLTEAKKRWWQNENNKESQQRCLNSLKSSSK
ncbi:MAG: hypothetical protein WCT77_01985 [Bacteroidota bacterium]|jgi:group I intron endonuclease